MLLSTVPDAEWSPNINFLSVQGEVWTLYGKWFGGNSGLRVSWGYLASSNQGCWRVERCCNKAARVRELNQGCTVHTWSETCPLVCGLLLCRLWATAAEHLKHPGLQGRCWHNPLVVQIEPQNVTGPLVKIVAAHHSNWLSLNSSCTFEEAWYCSPTTVQKQEILFLFCSKP